MNEKWQKMKREIKICTLKYLLSTPGIGRKLAERIIKNRSYNKMIDLLKIRGIGGRRHNNIKLRFWCIGEK